MSDGAAVVHKAVRLLRASELGAAYENAWTSWVASDDSTLWDGTLLDGTAGDGQSALSGIRRRS